nr:MAG TPA: hypothetical protein [Crassvirales sp.]
MSLIVLGNIFITDKLKILGFRRQAVSLLSYVATLSTSVCFSY